MITLKLIQYGKTPREIFLTIQKKANDIVGAMINIAEQTRDLMRGTISYGSKQSREYSLQNAIDTETIVSGTNTLIGIGNIERLNKEAPYWWVLNYGTLFGTGTKYIPGRPASDQNTPKFIPGYWSGDIFVYAPFSGTGMVTKNPITPINYIDVGVNYFVSQIGKI